jgi:DNA-binding transcriptional MerR regulator
VSDRGKPKSGRVGKRRLPTREFYSIGEVCRTLRLKPHVLRYWETQFDALSPAKNRSGNRVYRSDDLELIALIQRLVHEEKYTIEGARHRLEEMRAGGDVAEQSEKALERSFLRMLRGELQAVHDLLDTTPR